MTTDISPADAATLPVSAPEPEPDLGDARYHGEPPADAAGTADGAAPAAAAQGTGTQYIVLRARRYAVDHAELDPELLRLVRDDDPADDAVIYQEVATVHARSAKEAIRAVRNDHGTAQYRAAPVRNWTGLGFTRTETVVEEEVDL